MAAFGEVQEARRRTSNLASTSETGDSKGSEAGRDTTGSYGDGQKGRAGHDRRLDEHLASLGLHLSIVQDPIYFNKLYREALEAYIQDTWWPAVRKDPSQYDYWRQTAQKRMGKFKVIAWEGQQVIQE
jgi:hypothetical protein